MCGRIFPPLPWSLTLDLGQISIFFGSVINVAVRMASTSLQLPLEVVLDDFK